MKLRWLLASTLVVAVALFAVILRDRDPVRSEYCVAQVGQVRAQVDLEQAQWSALMAAMAQKRGLPPRATTIAIATAFQESKIHNIDYGDRDSIGLFQQRPSQGWGSVEQILDPVYAIGKFYDGLVRVRGYEQMTITDAAQAVQRSAHPGAYAQHEDYARALASTLRGYSPSQFHCVVNPRDSGNVSTAAQDVRESFGLDVVVVGDQLQVPLVGEAQDVDARGWAVAHYLVANAVNLGLTEVRFDGRVWSTETSDRGWTVDPHAFASTVVASTN